MRKNANNKNILERLTDHARKRVFEAKTAVSTAEMRERALAVRQDAVAFVFEKALTGPGMSFICECKKASPSKGVIAEEFPYVDIAKSYEEAGASAISVLTEPKWFLGDLSYLEEITAAVKIPVLRKDFTCDEYMIYEAAAAGAAAVLLICAISDEETLSVYIDICNELGLSALVEAHDETEIEKACRAGARIIGVNNRDLRDFSVDVSNSVRLRIHAPQDMIFVAESGIKTREDIRAMAIGGIDAVLIGEQLMRAPDKKAELTKLKIADANTEQ